MVDQHDVRIAFDRWVCRGGESALEVRRLHWELIRVGFDGYILGGAVRDALLIGIDATPRDIDVAIDVPSMDALHSIAEACDFQLVRTTILGGLKVRRGSVTLDLWRLKDTLALRDLECPTAYDLAASTPLNIEAIALDLKPGGEVFDRGFCRAIWCKRIDANPEGDCSNVDVYSRASLLAERLGFELGPLISKQRKVQVRHSRLHDCQCGSFR